jgi:hypothetical protein
MHWKIHRSFPHPPLRETPVVTIHHQRAVASQNVLHSADEDVPEAGRLLTGASGASPSAFLFRLQNMGQNRGTAAADVLRHANFRAVHLGGATFAAQLLDNFDDLVHARRADRVAAGF